MRTSCHFHMSQNSILLLIFPHASENVKAILDSQAVQTPVGVGFGGSRGLQTPEPRKSEEEHDHRGGDSRVALGRAQV